MKSWSKIVTKFDQSGIINIMIFHHTMIRFQSEDNQTLHISDLTSCGQMMSAAGQYYRYLETISFHTLMYGNITNQYYS